MFVEIEKDQATEYKDYVHKIIAFLKSNDELYRKAILSAMLNEYKHEIMSSIQNLLT